MTVDLSKLLEFVHERLDEDERIARPAAPGPTPGPWRYNRGKQWHAPEDLADRVNGEEFVAAGPREDPVCVAVTGPADDPQSMVDALHIARHHPTRVLAEVRATRALLADLCAEPHGDSVWGAKFSCGASTDVYGKRLDPNDYAARRHECDCGRDERLFRRVRLLALPYADVYGYDETWRL